MKRFLFWFSVIELILIIIVFGFMRDFLFKNINYQMYHLYYQSTEEPPISPLLYALLPLTYYQLYTIKWLLTGFFSVLYLGITLMGTYLVYPQKSNLYYVMYCYGVLLLLSILFFGGGYVIGDPDLGYTYTRKCMGVAQSPLILMGLIPALRLLQVQGAKSTSENSEETAGQ